MSTPLPFWTCIMYYLIGNDDEELCFGFRISGSLDLFIALWFALRHPFFCRKKNCVSQIPILWLHFFLFLDHLQHFFARIDSPEFLLEPKCNQRSGSLWKFCGDNSSLNQIIKFRINTHFFLTSFNSTFQCEHYNI